MKYIIIEDEAMAADLLHEMIAELRPQWTLENSMPTVAKSVEFLKSHDVDLIFMDIELADGSGFNIFNYVTSRHLSSSPPPTVSTPSKRSSRTA